MKRVLSWLLAIALMASCVPAGVVEAEAAQQTPVYTAETVVVSDPEPVDHEQLLEGYAYQLFYGGMATYGRKAGDRLTGNDKKAYDALVPIIKQLAAGTRSSTVIGLGETLTYGDDEYIADVSVAFSGSDLDLHSVIAALLTDLPYEMYWYDKINGTSTLKLCGQDIAHLRLSFSVVQNYRGAQPYTVDCAQAQAAATAANNSAAIVAKYAGKTDYEKLSAYKDEICSLVTYNYDAAYTGDFSTDNDPWQLIYVFDGDDTTNVVCEGYSKAFMYLCEQTAFAGDVSCITVSGRMGGPHMWNVVSIDGASYLVDVTNSEPGAVGQDGSLFLAGGIGDVINGYTVGSCFYHYYDQVGAEGDADTLLWGAGMDSILALSPVAYTARPSETTPNGFCGENMLWYIDDAGTLHILGSGHMAGYDVGTAPWYAYRNSIQTVVISDGVLSVGSYAFYGCEDITKITVPDSVQTIDSYAFYCCKSLQAIHIPAGVRAVDDYVFFGCESLETVDIPDSVTYIGWYAFCKCSSLKEVTFGRGVQRIQSGAFNQCTSLEEVVLPEGLVTLGQAFSQCSALKSVTFPATLQKITGDAFWYCEALTDVYIRDADAWCKVDFENDYANPNLYAKQLHLLDENGQEVTGITLGNTVTSIPNFAFKNMTALTSVSVPATVDSIGEYAFGNCVNLMEASVPETLTIIPEGLFQGCGKLTSFKIPGAVTKIDQYAFDGCSSLSDFDLFYGITEIGENAFRDCIGASSVFVPSSITTIGSGAFYGCTGLTAVYISDLDAWCRIDFGNSGANPLAYAGDLYVYGAPVTELDFPTGIGKVNDYAFFNCTSLTSVTIPNDVEQVGIYAFANCSNLTDVVLKIGVKQIGDGVFQRCSALTYVSIPVTVRTIGGWAFCECTGLTEIAIPDSVTDIGSFAFSDCKNLDSVTITDVDAWCQIQFADWWSNPLYNGATLYLSGERIKDMVISEAVQEIGKYAFIGQTDLVSVTLPAGLTAVGERAFEKCSSLTDVYFLGTEYQWQQVNIGIYNEWLEQATVHFTNGHVHSLVYYEGKEPTCSQVGWNAYKACSTCQYTTYEEIPTAEHRYTGQEVSATCTTDGYIINTCELCGHTYTQIYQQAWGHMWDDGVVTVAPTEESTGIKTYTCRNCPEMKTEELPIIQHTHSYQSVVTPATCEEDGYTTHTCACGDSYVDSAVAAKGHSWGKWTVKTPAGCTTEGIQSRMCNRCKATESQAIQPTEKHNYVPSVTPPTCTQQGYTTYTCACGDSYVDNYTPAGDHSYNPVVYQPTCTEEGFTIYTCTCGEKYIGDYVEPAGHAYGDWVDVKAPTCLESGTQNRTCTGCWSVQAQTVPATGHKYTPTEVVAPTYSTGGYTVYTCVCGDSYTDDAVKPLTLPKLTIQVAGNMLQWEYEASVDEFEIWRATSKSGKYTKVGTVKDFDFADTPSVGKTYYYKVRAIIGYDAKYNSGYSNVVSIKYTCAEPVLVLSTNSGGKPVLTWNKVSGAKKYEVYRATSETGKYTKVTTVTKTTYTDSKASTGTRYFYKVRAVASSSTYNSGYSNITSCWIICATPSVTAKTDAATGKPTFSWSTVSGATGYCIERRLPGVTGWEMLDQITGKTFTDTTAAIDTQYEYRVQAVGKEPELDSAKTHSMFITSGLAMPKPTGSINSNGKPVISWPMVDGAVKYTIYRSTSSSKNFKAVETVTELSYTDTSVAVGKTYYYKVTATGQNSVSAQSAYVKLTGKCDIPELTVKAGSTGKPVLTWNKISGAKKYEIWRSVDGAAFKKLTTVTATTYTDSKATEGAECTYKVKALGSSSSYNGNFSEELGCKVICAAPGLTVKIDTVTGKPSLSWSKVTGATGYAIYRNEELLTTITGVSYLDTAAETDGQYSYYVVTIGKNDDFNSIASATKTVTAVVGQPKVTGAINANGKPVITWEAVEDAVAYKVYRSTSSSKSYKEIETVTDLSYTDTSVAAGKTYYYKVMAVGENSKGAQSAYVKLTGKCDIPTLNVAAGSTGKPVLTWNKISGAKKYEIWRSVDGAAFKKLTTVTATTYTDSKATEGAECTYKVKALGSKSSYNGNFSQELGCIVVCAAPSLSVKIDTATGKPNLSWSKVTGAAGYEIYRNENGGEYSLLATVTGTSHKDNDAQAGIRYGYKMITLGKSEVFNSIESAVKTATATCAQPKLNGSLDSATGKPSLTWGEIDGAESYVIYRSTSKSKGYKKIGTAETNTYIDADATAKKTYYYKVEALAGSTKSIQSGYVKLTCGSGPVPVKVSTVEISGPTQVMVGNQIALIATVTPDNAANKAITWSITSGSSYASISSDGVLTAKKVGTVKIKAAAKDGSGKSDTYTVSVVKKTLWEGSGTKSNPYLLRTVEDLQKLPEVLNQSGLYFKQAADIDCASVENWIVIGTTDKPFRHNIDGGGYTVSNLCLDGEAQGLFSWAKDAQFRNMKIVNAHTKENHRIEEGYSNKQPGNGGDTGAIVGYATGCSFENCTATVNFLSSNNATGGLVGFLVLKNKGYALMENCHVSGTVTGNGYVGGLIGQIWRYMDDDVYAPSATITVKNCSADVNIKVFTASSESCVGGLIGESFGVRIENCHASGSIDVIEGDIGGLVGNAGNYTDIIRCYAEVDIHASSDDQYGGVSAGGLIGHIYSRSDVYDCYATGDISAPNVKWSPCQDATPKNGGPWRRYYNPCGSLIGTLEVFRAYAEDEKITVYNCYATGKVDVPNICEDERVYCHGALIGLTLDRYTITNVLDKTKKDQSSWDGLSEHYIGHFGNNYNLENLRTYYAPINDYTGSGVSGLKNPKYTAVPTHEFVQIVTQDQLKDTATFEGWDFVNVWQMTANGPTLR